MTIHALLDSPSITGAYTFVVEPGDTTIMQVDAHLFPRRKIERLGIAPMTSMFQCGETTAGWLMIIARRFTIPTVCSSGPARANGSGGQSSTHTIFRVNSFLDDNPRGFGLLQRDRVFDHYQDDGAFYNKRPRCG